MGLTKQEKKDFLKINIGLEHLSGYFSFGKHVGAYKKQYVYLQKQKDGSIKMFDRRLQKVISEKELQSIVVKAVTGTKTPFKDRKFLANKVYLERAKNLGNAEDGLSMNDIFWNIRKHFSPPVKDTEGKLLGKQVELKRNEKLTKWENAITNELFKGTKYERIANKERAESLNKENFKLAGEFPGTKEEFEAKYGSNASVTSDKFYSEADVHKGKRPYIPIVHEDGVGVTRIYKGHPDYQAYKSGEKTYKNLPSFFDGNLKNSQVKDDNYSSRIEPIDTTLDTNNELVDSNKIDKKKPVVQKTPTWDEKVSKAKSTNFRGRTPEQERWLNIERAYGSMNQSVKEKLANQPITQLELEAW